MMATSLVGARGQLDAHCQISIFLSFGFFRFVGKSTFLQPPVTQINSLSQKP